MLRQRPEAIVPEIWFGEDPDVELLGQLPRACGHVAGDSEDGHRSREGSPEGDRFDSVTLDGRGVPVFT